MIILTDEDKTALILQYGDRIVAVIETICDHYDGLYSDRSRIATCMEINQHIRYSGMEVGRIKDPTLFIKDGNKEVNIAELLKKINYNPD